MTKDEAVKFAIAQKDVFGEGSKMYAFLTVAIEAIKETQSTESEER